MVQQSRWLAFGLSVAMAALLAAAPADAAQSKCIAGKIKCIANKTAGLLKCHQTAETPGKPIDQSACIAKVQLKFEDPTTGCFAKLEAKNQGCITFGDAAAVEDAVDACVDAFVLAVDPLPVTQSKCNAGKKKCMANKAKGLLKCYQKAATPNKPTDPNDKDCITKVQAKFEEPTKGCFAKLEAKNDGCETLGNAPAVELLIDDCVEDLVEQVNPPTTTTTSTTVTTTTSVSSTTSSSVTTTSSSTTSSAPTTTSSSTSSTSSSSSSTSTSSTSTSTSSTSTSTSTTSTSIPVANPTAVDLTVTLGGGVCGEIRDGSSNLIRNLTCGGLNIGGGSGNTVAEGLTPPGSTNRFAISGCVGNSCTLTGSALGVATATRDCTSATCFFGVPLPIPNGAQTTCVVNRFAAAGSGTLDISTGVITDLSIQLSSSVRVTGNSNVAQPCPVCTVVGTPSPTNPLNGTCSRGLRAGLSCTTTNPTGLSKDCLPGGADASVDAGTIAVNLTPLTTGTRSVTNATGAFCPSQTTVGCFGSSTCRTITENGTPAGSLLPIGTPKAIRLASTFCVPTTTNALVNFAARLPGPGALSLVGDLTLIP